MTDADILWALTEEFGRGNIEERPLDVPGWHLDGLSDGQKVYVDPAPNIVESLLHELLHRRFPRWSEAHVNRVAHRLLRKMTRAEVQKWYRAYQRTARKVTRPLKVDEVE